MPETIKNKELMKICETYVDTLYYQREENRTAFLMGAAKLRKGIKTVVKNTVKTTKRQGS